MKIHGHLLIQANAFYIKQSIPMIHDYIIAEIGSDRKSGSTAAIGKICDDNHIPFITVDIDSEAICRSEKILNKFPGLEWRALLMDGKKYLETIGFDKLALLYLDAVDLDLAGSYRWHFSATKIAIDKIVPGGFICIDDTRFNKKWIGKGAMAVPYLVSNDWKIVSYLPGAVLLQKSCSFMLPEYNKWVFWIQFIRYRYIKKWLS